MFTDPVKNLKQFGLWENMVVADLGAGTGFYTLAAAEMVPQGKVYAIEIQADFVNVIKNKIKEKGFNNVNCFLGNVEKIGGTLLGDETVDRVIASNILFQIENKDRFIEEIKRILKMTGKVLLVDWSDASSIHSNLRKIVPKEKAEEIFKARGFILEKEINVSEHHYGMIFKKGSVAP